jgi:hypothetical protein
VRRVDARFQVLTAMKIHVAVIWVETSRNGAVGYITYISSKRGKNLTMKFVVELQI